MQSSFRNVSISEWDSICAKMDALLFKGNGISARILVDICVTVLDEVKITSTLKGPGLVVKTGYKKPIVPVNMQHCAVRVGIVFVSVELVNVAKMVNLHVGPRLTNRQGDLSMRLVATKQAHQKNQPQIYCGATTKKWNIKGLRTHIHIVGTVDLVAPMT